MYSLNKNKKHALGIFLLCMLFVFSARLSVATDISISAQVGAVIVDGGGGGGGGGGGNNSATEVEFSGRAYPYSTVIVLKNGKQIVSTVAGGDAKFSISVGNLTTGSYTFSILAEDDNGIRSTLFTFPLYVSEGISTTISGIYIAPTISVDKSVVQKGDVISIFGQSSPNALITINVNSLVPHFVSTYSDSDGVYLSAFNTSVLEIGSHTTKSQSSLINEFSSYSNTVEFEVGLDTVLSGCATTGDLTNDCRVNIVDFSVLAYWYGRTGFPLELDLSGDSRISLVDFSIMAYYWTG